MAYSLIHRVWKPINPYTPLEIKEMKKQTRRLVTERACYFSPIMGVMWNKIRISTAHTRWGSCSSNGNLNFNCTLCLLPPEIADSIIVHELAHLIKMNHSKEFWDVVALADPNYKDHKKWLKENGGKIIIRLP